MANTLKIKRGTAATIPQGQLAEPLFTTDTYDLYIGKGSGGNQRIQNYIASGTSSQFLKGDGSLDSTTYQATSEKGQNNGYASLDSGGKIPASQLPSSVIEYKGTWNASTNTPTLADGTGDAGDVYIVSVGGTQNLGSGSITFDAGDWVMYNGSVWQKSTGSNAVASVNGQTGVVVLDTDDISEPVSATNLWFTNARARTSISLTTTGSSGMATYDNMTGVLNVPNYSISGLGGVPTSRQLTINGTAYDLSADRSWSVGTVTSVAALTIGTTGTDITSTVATGTTTPVITLNIPTASATNRGALSSTDWSTFNDKQAQLNGTGFVKASGTTITYDNSTYLTTSSAASTYLPLTGGTLTGALIGTTASFTSNSGNFNLGTQAGTAIYAHIGSKSASGGQAVAMRLAGTLTATANFDNLFGLWVDYTDNTAGYAGVTRYGIYQNDSAKRNYFGGPTTFNSAVTGSDTITATAFIPSGTSVPSRGMYTSASNVLDFSAGTTNLLSLNYNTGLSTFNTGVRGYYFRIVNVSTAEFGINTENNQGYIGTTTSHGFNIMTNNTPRLEFHATTGAATFSSSVTAGQGLFTSTSYPLDLTANTNNYGIRLTSVQAPSLLLYSTYNTANNRNWGIFTNYAVFGDFAIAQSNAKDGDLTTGANGTARLYLRNDGNVGIGTTSPNASLHLYKSSGNVVMTLQTGTSYGYVYNDGTNVILGSDVGTTGAKFLINRNAPDNAMSITSGGNVGINTSGNTTSTPHLFMSTNGALFNGGSADVYFGTNFYYNSAWYYRTANKASMAQFDGGNIIFKNTDTTGSAGGSLTWAERMRITSGGDVLVNQTSSNIATTGTAILSTGRIRNCVDGSEPMEINRKSSDGKLIIFYQDTVEEGNISVAGSTVSYNGGHLARWTQSENAEKIDGLLKGTVMSNLDKMAEWINPETGEPYANEQLNCMKISDIEGDINVAGVFVNYDNDNINESSDMNIAMTGDMIIRIAQGVLVEKGQLLMSAGDGTAKPQEDDIIRAKTIAKVTSNHVTCVYEDGSYCVPCVLMAC